MRIPTSPDLTVLPAESEPEVLEARRFHGRRYLESGFVESLDACGVINDPYVDTSDYFVVRHVPDWRLVGVCRFIRHSPIGLPLLANFNIEEPYRSTLSFPEADNCYEVSALATESTGFQQLAVAGCLYRQTIRYLAMRPRHVHLLAVVDQRLLRLLRRGLHFPFEQIGPAAEFMGDTTIPVYGYMPDLMKSVLEADPLESSYLFDGRRYEEMNSTILDLRELAPEIVDLRTETVA